MNKKPEKIESQTPSKLLENIDYYFENGLMVLTAHFLKKRGYCCRNACRHCPYSEDEKRILQEESR